MKKKLSKNTKTFLSIVISFIVILICDILLMIID